jgi:hypothetical protein
MATDELSQAVMSSALSMTTYTLAQPTQDTTEPLRLDNVGMAPVSDVTEPIAVN